MNTIRRIPRFWTATPLSRGLGGGRVVVVVVVVARVVVVVVAAVSNRAWTSVADPALNVHARSVPQTPSQRTNVEPALSSSTRLAGR